MATLRKKFLYVDDPTASKILLENLDLLIKEMEVAFVSFSQGESGGVVQPVRASMPVNDHNGVLMTMPVYSRQHNCMAVKLITFYPQRTGIGGVVLYYDPQTGQLKAIIEGNQLSVIRTTTATLIAVKHLTQENASVLAVIGCGLEGHWHAKLLKHVRNFKEIRLWNRTKEKALRLAEEVGGTACYTVEEAVKNADVIVTVTSSEQTVLHGKWVKQGALVNIVGGNLPNFREADDELMKSSQIIADSKDGVSVESGDVILSGVSVDGELGDIISGTLKPDFSRTRVFKSQGMAVEDGVSAKIVYEKFVEESEIK